MVVSLDGELKMKAPNPRLELPYTYVMAWYVMHYPFLISIVRSSENSMPFVQRLERSNWNG